MLCQIIGQQCFTEMKDRIVECIHVQKCNKKIKHCKLNSKLLLAKYVCKLDHKSITNIRM